MGGNALKEYTVIRLPAKEAIEIGSAIKAILDKELLTLDASMPQARIIASYADKETFGDIDILVPNTLRDYLSNDALAAMFASVSVDALPLPYVQENPKSEVVSFGVRLKSGTMFQADLIFVPIKTMDFTYRFYSWNDLGALLSRVANKMGLKLTHTGLHLDINLHVEQQSHVKLKDIAVTTDFNEAVTFLGFDAARHEAGFKTLSSMFEFVQSGAYFDPDIYQLALRSAEFRARVVKRTTYLHFLDWVKDNQIKAIQPIEWFEDKRQWLPKIQEAFPHVKALLDAQHLALQAKKEFKEKFNGEVVAYVTGFSGKALGEAMSKLNNLINKLPLLVEFISLRTQPYVYAWIASNTIVSGYPEDSDIHQAAMFAAGAHAFVNQRRKYTNEPYINHPQEVAKIVAEYTDDPVIIMAAWLHDTVEDTEVTYEDILANFTPAVANTVSYLTDISKPEDGNRTIRKALDRAHSAAGTYQSQTAKLADLISNTRSIAVHDIAFARLYLEEKQKLLELLTNCNMALHAKAVETLIYGQGLLVQSSLLKMDTPTLKRSYDFYTNH